MFSVRGRFYGKELVRDFKKSSEEADALVKDETISVSVPYKVDVLVYRSMTHGDYVSHVILETECVETGEAGYFGSEWRYPEKPTRDQVRAHVVDMLDHEVRHQLGMDPHGS